ncbi:MAG: LamG domain-containing protein, partial [Gammaproteobacteria bacterium]|nr:LamG domain-containing protein [Gammaproteobacteria bacterium]
MITVIKHIVILLFIAATGSAQAAAPTHDAPILTSALGTDTTDEDLTSTPQNTFDADGDDVKNIFNWYKDTVPLQVLNMPFEGGSDGSSTKDYSDSSNDGTVSGATWNATGGYDGKGAYDFTGSGGIVINDDPTIRIGVNDFTISLWFYTSSYSSYETLFDKGTGGSSRDYSFWIDADSSGYIAVGNQRGSGWSSSGFTTNAWHHFVMKREGNTVSIFLDGGFKFSKTVTGITDSGGNLEIGGNPSGGGTDWSGKLDDFQIFNHSLSAEQIANLAAGNPQIIDSEETTLGETWQSCVTPNDGTEDGLTKCSNDLTIVAGSTLIAEWRMDEDSWNGTAGEVVDETGNGNDGTAKNGADTDDTSPAIVGDPGTCGYGVFDGSNDYIEVPGLASPAILTAMAWVNPSSYNTWSSIMMQVNNGWSEGWGLTRHSNGNVVFHVGDYSTTNAATTVPENSWTHIAGVYDGNTIYIYKNGVLADSNTIGAVSTATLNPLLIGDSIWKGGGVGTDLWNGAIDEVRVYNSALTQAQIEVVLNETHDCHGLPNIIVSTLNNSTLGGQAIDQDEAVQYDGITGTLFLDQSTFSNNANTYGLHAIDDGTGNILIATGNDETIDGVTFGDDDIVRVSPTGTAGVYDSTVIVFDGGTHFVSDNERIDAVYQKKSDGNIILSTRGHAQLPKCGGGNLDFRRDDLVEWDTGSNCVTMFLDESATSNLIPNADGQENINGVHLLNDDPNLILFTLLSDNTIRGTAVLDGDVILYNVSGDTASIYFAESEFSSGDEDVSAITLSV